MKKCICAMCGVFFYPLDEYQKICECCQDDLDECNEGRCNNEV